MGVQLGQSMTHSGGFIKIFSKYINIDKTSRVEGEDQDYKLSIGGYNYTSTAGDSMNDVRGYGYGDNNGMKFTTRDRNNNVGDLNCAQIRTGAWWFKG